MDVTVQASIEQCYVCSVWCGLIRGHSSDWCYNKVMANSMDA